MNDLTIAWQTAIAQKHDNHLRQKIILLQMSEIKVRDYIEQQTNKQPITRFADLEWLKLYLETIAQGELHLVEKFFLTALQYTREISKWRCANIINGIFCTLVDHVDSQLLDEIVIASNPTDEKFLIASTLTSFLIQDLLNIVIDYGLSVRFKVGMYIDVLDAQSTWDLGEIKQILQYKNNLYLLIHYVECSEYYDECIIANSERLRLLYDDSGQIVYKWAPVVLVSSEVLEVDYRISGESIWKRCTMYQVERWILVSHGRTNVAPAGTFLKHSSINS